MRSPEIVAVDSVSSPPSPSLGSEAVRYLLASIAALALDAATLALLVRTFDLAPWSAGACAYLAGLVFIYVVSVRWVFAKRAVRNGAGEFAAFAALGCVGLVLNSATLEVATAAGLALPVAKAISAGIGFVANFVSRKAILFSRGAR